MDDRYEAKDLTTLLPAAILTLSYSREFEREADQYAIDELIKKDVAPIHFYNVMKRLTEVKHSRNNGTVSRYLSTHPTPKDRLDYIDGWQHIYESMKAQKKLDAYRGEVAPDARPACCTKSPLDAAKAKSPH